MAASASASDYSEDFEDEGASERSTRAGQRGGRRRHEMPAEDKQEVSGSGGELRPSQKPSIAKNKLKGTSNLSLSLHVVRQLHVFFSGRKEV